jgi:hypothetical protein
MEHEMIEPAELPSKTPADGSASATQLSILLSSATSAIDEEFKRSERLDAKSRNQIMIVGSFFTVVQAVVVGLFNGSLAGTEHHAASSFIPWLAIAGAAASVTTIVAGVYSYKSWKLLKDPTLSINTILAYIPGARDGNPAVGVKLVEAYAGVAKGRRENNEKRAAALNIAVRACGVALLFISIELVLAFVAAAVQ